MGDVSVKDVYPVPKTKRGQKNYEAGPIMSADAKPVRDGMYLRDFGDDWAWSWWADGHWCRDEFWTSDEQELPWRGAVKKGPAYGDMTRDMLVSELDDVKRLALEARATIAELYAERGEDKRTAELCNKAMATLKAV